MPMFSVLLAQGIKKSEIFQPPRVLVAEMIEARPRLLIGLLEKFGCGALEQRKLRPAHLVVVDRAYTIGKTGEHSWIEPAMFAQPFHADEQRISRKSGSRGIGRVPVRRGVQRQHLPQSLARRCEEVEKFVGRRAEVADASARW